MFGSKIIGLVGDKSRELTDKLVEKYRDQVGEELLLREAKLIHREAELGTRESHVLKREQQIDRYYLVPKIYLKVPVALALLCGGAYLAYQAFVPTGGTVAGAASIPDDSCYTRGVAYYKEIGSYPYLSTGVRADIQVREMCSRSNMAFVHCTDPAQRQSTICAGLRANEAE